MYPASVSCRGGLSYRPSCQLSSCTLIFSVEALLATVAQRDLVQCVQLNLDAVLPATRTQFDSKEADSISLSQN
eukprot:IDg5137t1